MRSCVDCDAQLSNGRGTMVAVHVNDPVDGGYDRIRMPACRHCALKRRGYECDHCGELHETNRLAYDCCVGTSKAPDCPECGRRMAVVAQGYDPTFGPDITYAKCEDCDVGWGRFTGFDGLEEGDSA